jgi:beta-glucanase (GH16 family)
MMPDRGPEGGDLWQRRSTHNGAMEIDIMEHLAEWGPGRYNVAAHWDGYEKQHQSWGNSKLTYSRTADDFHVFGLLWEEGKLTFFCDGEEKERWENERVSSVPVYLKLCVQMGGWATKDVDDGALPDFMVVDWVRAWQRAPAE